MPLASGARDVLGVKIPAEGSPVMCPRSRSMCTLCHTLSLPSAGVTRGVMPLRGRHGGGANSMIEAVSLGWLGSQANMPAL